MPPTELRAYVERFYKDMQHAFHLLNYDIATGATFKTVVFRVAEGSPELTDG